ncbi:MAG: kelch repeat-containing protein, partial [Thermoanaerobaculia bacterium]
EYDPAKDVWTRKAPMPTPRHGLAAVGLGGKVYVLGGSNGSAPSRALDIYDPATNTWEPGPPMPTARVFLAAAVVGRKIYAIGGSPDCCGEGRTDAVEVYDPDLRSWSTAEPLPVALQVSAAATAANGKIYVFGGFIPGAGVQESIFEYDPASGNWTTKETRLPFPPRDQAPAVGLGGGIHLLGGSTDCHCQALADHDRYEPDVEPSADLRIAKANGLARVCPRQLVQYTIKVSNAGPDAVRGASVKDTVPAELAGATWTCTPSSPGAACAVQGLGLGTVNLPAGGAAAFTLAGALAASASGRLTNAVRVDPPAAVPDRAPRNNSARDSDPVVPCPLPSITKTDGRASVTPGDAPLYEITVVNLGPAPLPVTVTDELSTSGLIDVRWCQGVGCTPSVAGDLVDAELLPANGTLTYRATGTVPGTPPCACDVPAKITNTARVALDDGRSASATDVDLIPSLPPADLGVAITTSPGVVECALPHTITVTNHGPGTACGVVLGGGASGDFALEALSTPCAAGLPCALGDIPPGSAVVVTAFLAPAPGAKCPAVGALTASAESLCPAPGDRDDASESVKVLCDLGVTKTDGQDTAAPGDPILYTIEVTNLCCVTVPAATVRDTFPAELVGVEWCRGAGCTPTIPAPPDLVDTLGLAPGETETYRASGTISPAFIGTLSNTACVEYDGDDTDPTPANNCATDLTEVDFPPPPGGSPLPIPGASDCGLATLALLLAAFALARIRRAARAV